jgi:hypothetical protein
LAQDVARPSGDRARWQDESVANRRTKEEFEFTPPDVDRVRAQLARLTEAADGWINLLPGVDMDDAERPTVPTGLFGLFGNRQPPVTMATLVPPKSVRRGTDGVTIGLLHPTGSKAIARLREAGVDLPTSWAIRQDHARRGLVVQSAVGTPEAEVINWAVRAGTALCREEMTGRWQAVVYLP